MSEFCNDEWGEKHMKIEIVGNEIVLKFPINKPLTPSKSGKSMILATSNGIVPTTVQYEGKVVKAGVNIFVDAN
jgi:hypothetical protein